MQKQLQIVFSTSFISDCYEKMRAPPRNLFSKLHVNGYEFWHLPHTTSNPLPPPKKKKTKIRACASNPTQISILYPFTINFAPSVCPCPESYNCGHLLRCLVDHSIITLHHHAQLCQNALRISHNCALCSFSISAMRKL